VKLISRRYEEKAYIEEGGVGAEVVAGLEDNASGDRPALLLGVKGSFPAAEPHQALGRALRRLKRLFIPVTCA
jgi:hypothetical protein